VLLTPWLASWNDTPKTLVWKATAEVNIDKVRRYDKVRRDKELARTAS
jgi:hypothetical protein